MKKWLTKVLLVMLILVLPVTAFAASAKKDGRALNYDSNYMYHIDILVEADYEYTLSFAKGQTVDHADMEIKKEWDVPAGTALPSSVKVQVMKTVNGSTSVYRTVTLSGSNGWSATLYNMPLFENGAAVTYSVEEDGVSADGYYNVVVTEVHSTLDQTNQDRMIYTEGGKQIVFYYDSSAPYMVVGNTAYTNWDRIGTNLYQYEIDYSADGRTYTSIWQYDAAKQVYTYISDDYMTVTEIDFVTYTDYESNLTILYDRGNYVTAANAQLADADISNGNRAYFNYVEQTDTNRADQEFWSTNRAIGSPDNSRTPDLPHNSYGKGTVVTVGYDYVYTFYDKFGVRTVENDTAVQSFNFNDTASSATNWCGEQSKRDTQRGYDVMLQLSETEYYHGDGPMETHDVTITNSLAADLTITKTVNGEDTGEEFDFVVTLGELNGALISDTFNAAINGKATTVTFVNGVATVRMGNGDKLVIEDLPVGVTYEIEEQVGENYVTTSTGETGTIVAGGSTAAFVNEKVEEVGKLRVTKTTTGNDVDHDDEFTIQVEINGGAAIAGPHVHHAHYIVTNNGNETTANGFNLTFVDGVATFNIKSGETIEIIKLPAGATYEVTEIHHAGYEVTYTGNTGTIAKDGTAQVIVNNHRETQEGELSITKKVVSNLPSDSSKEFTFTVTLVDSNISGTHGGMTFVNGVATVKIKPGQTVTATNLPVGIEYTVVEAAENYFTSKLTNANGTIGSNATVAVEATNTRQTGDLVVSKQVVSSFASCYDNTYYFTIKLSEALNGTFGDVTFTNGVADVTLQHDDVVTISGLPAGITYQVLENLGANSAYESTSTGASGTIPNGTATAAFTNKHKTSHLSLNKKVVSDLAADRSRYFTFTVVLEHDGTSNEPINGTFDLYVNGRKTGTVTFTNGTAEVRVRANQTVTIEGLPVNAKYKVTEVVPSGFTQTKASNTTGTIAAAGSTVSFTNTRKTGSLTVEKTLNSELEADKNLAFEFTVTLSDTTINGTYGGMTFTNGVATFTLKGGESKTANGLPTSVRYTVTETAVDGMTITKTGDTGTITTGNAKAIFTNTRETGNLSITKILENALAQDKDNGFTFDVYLSDESINGYYGDFKFHNGWAPVELKGGETKTATGLPAGLTYKIEEQESYWFKLVSFEGNEGTIEAGKTAEAVFTNTRKTGDLTVEKKLVSDLAADKNVAFKFTVTLSDKSINGEYGDMTFANGVATFTLKGGERKTATSLPVTVNYTVTEESLADMVTTKTGETGMIQQEAATATFTNTRKTGGLTVSKALVSDLAADKNAEFKFKVTLSEGSLNGTYGGMTFINGVAEFTLKDGESKSADGLPVGVTYTYEVREEANDDFVITSQGATGTVSSNKFAHASFTNTRKTGDLTVEKKLESNLTADKNVAFKFAVTLSDKSISGAYGDMTFTNGVATFTLKGGECKTATGLPTSVKYTVTEETVANMVTTKSGDTGEITTEPAKAVFTNTRKTGDLTVSKELVSALAADQTAEFEFTVTLSDRELNGTYGDMTFTNGVAIFTLKGGESKNANGLPAGVTYTYEIKEKANDDFVITSVGATGTVSSEKPATAVFTNTRKTGDLTVKKSITGDGADLTKKFQFRVELSDVTINGAYGDMMFVSGVATFELGNGEGKTATGLPAGVQYNVSEASGEYTVTKTGDVGVIAANATAAASFANHKEKEPEPEPEYGSLRVSKTITGDGADLAKQFTFTVMLSDVTINGAYGDMVFVSGVATFELGNGESKTATGLPAGIQYNVSEASGEYTVTKTGDVGVIAANATAAASFTNHKEKEPEPEPEYGSLRVSKTITGDGADLAKKFTFTVMLSDVTINGVYGDMVFVNGVATFELGNGEGKTATGLPVGVRYAVEELDFEDYVVTSINESGVINANTTYVSFVNHRDMIDIPDTGDQAPLHLYGAMMILSAALMILMSRKAKKA